MTDYDYQQHREVKPITREQGYSFRDAARRQQQQWAQDLPDYTFAAGTPPVYDQMGRVLLQRMRADGLDPRFDSTGVVGGLAILPRWLYAGAAKANQLGYDSEALYAGMYNHATFQNLSWLTQETNATAVQMELELGLRMGGIYTPDARLDLYTFDPEHGLGYRDFDRLVREGRIEATLRKGTLQDVSTGETRCEGERSGVNAMAYRTMLLICLEDPNLFQATLARDFSTVRS